MERRNPQVENIQGRRGLEVGGFKEEGLKEVRMEELGSLKLEGS